MRAVIIGVGRMGRRHIQAVRQVGLELVGICDSLQTSLDLALIEQGVPRELHFQNPDRLLKETKPECVVIATTAPSHCPLTCLAAESGVKYILCEKPMATSLADCDRMISACASSGAKLAINHQMRFMEQFVLPKRLLASEEFQGLRSMTLIAGNFGFAMNGTHYIEAFRFISDEFPYEVTAWIDPEKVPNPRGAEFEDLSGSMRVTTLNGKRFYLEAGADQGHGLKTMYAGKFGQIVVDELEGSVHTIVRNAEHRDLPATRYAMPHTSNSYSIAPVEAVTPTVAVLNSLLAGNNYPDGFIGRQAVAVQVAAYISDKHGHIPIVVDDRLPSDLSFPWA